MKKFFKFIGECLFAGFYGFVVLMFIAAGPIGWIFLLVMALCDESEPQVRRKTDKLED